MKKIFNAIIMGLVLVLSALSVSAARLPAVGEDSNQWGTILNDYLQVSHDENGTLKATLSPTFNETTLTGRLIMDNPGPTFSGASSRQTVQADAIFSSFTGGYGAGVMGNAVSGTIGAGNSIIGGVIGKYNLVDSSPSDHPQGAVIGEIGEDVGTTTLPDGAFIAVLGGDTAEVDAGAAYTVRYLNSVPGSKFNYGLDLSGVAIDSYNPVTYGTADIRLSNGATIYNNDANTLTITEGTIVLAGDLTLNSGVINTAEIANDAVKQSKLNLTDITLSDFTNDFGYSTVTNDTIQIGTSQVTNLASFVVSNEQNPSNATITIPSTQVTGLGSLATLSTVTTSEITDGTIATADIAAGAIIGGAGGVISDNSITASDIAPDAVASSEIAADAVGASELADDSVASANIIADTIVAEDIATGAVTTTEILDGTITNADIDSLAAIAGTKINPDFGTQRLILDNPGPTFTGAGSRQAVQADATFNAYTGSSYGAGVMGNVLSAGTGVSGGQSIIAGVIGKYNVVTNVGTGPKGAVVGEVGEDGASADGAIIAVLGGDPAGTMTPGAAFTVRKLNSQAASKFNYGIDLFSTGNAPYNQPVNFGIADIRLSTGVTIRTGVGDPSGACSTGDMYLDATGGTDTTVLFVCQNSAWAPK